MVSKALLICMQFFNSAQFAVCFTCINDMIIELYDQACYYPFDFTGSNRSVISSLMALSFVIGQTLASFTMPITRKFWTIKQSCIFYCICLIIVLALMFVPVHWGYLFVLRLLQGITQMSVTGLTNTWIAEYDPQVNKFYSPFISTNIMINNALMAMVQGKSELWSLTLLYGMVTVLVLFGLILYTPQKKQMQWSNIVSMREAGEQEEKQEQKLEQDKSKWYTMVSRRDLIIIQVFLGISSQITGISNAVYFASTQFQRVFSGVSSFYSSIIGSVIMGFCKALSSFLCIPLTKKVKVIYDYCVGLFVTVIANVIQAVSFIYYDESAGQNQSTEYTVLVLFSAILFITSFELSAGCLQFYINGVVCQFGNPTMLNSVMFGVWSATNMIVCFTYPYFLDFYYAIYTIYAVLTIIATFIMTFFIVKNKPLMEALDNNQ